MLSRGTHGIAEVGRLTHRPFHAQPAFEIHPLRLYIRIAKFAVGIGGVGRQQTARSKDGSSPALYTKGAFTKWGASEVNTHWCHQRPKLS
jgi:hypothetical protein